MANSATQPFSLIFTDDFQTAFQAGSLVDGDIFASPCTPAAVIIS